MTDNEKCMACGRIHGIGGWNPRHRPLYRSQVITEPRKTTPPPQANPDKRPEPATSCSVLWVGPTHEEISEAERIAFEYAILQQRERILDIIRSETEQWKTALQSWRLFGAPTSFKHEADGAIEALTEALRRIESEPVQ